MYSRALPLLKLNFSIRVQYLSCVIYFWLSYEAEIKCTCLLNIPKQNSQILLEIVKTVSVAGLNQGSFRPEVGVCLECICDF